MTMISPQSLTSGKRSQSTFYPTPESIADKMLEGVNWLTIESILEPSAGKGDLAEYCARKIDHLHGRYAGESKSKEKIDCVEYDPNLRMILSGKGFRVVHDDFLSFQTHKHYNLIVMNPPFDQGDKHLLKAIEIAKKSGGKIVCLLNAETLRNPYSYTRQRLVAEIMEMGGTVEEVSGAFRGAERKTGVEIAIVKLEIPEPKRSSTILDELRRDEVEGSETEPESPYRALVKGDYIEALIDRFNHELKCGLTLIEEYNALQSFFKADILGDGKNGMALSLQFTSLDGRHSEPATRNGYITKTRKKYWEALFRQKEFVSQLTSNLQQELYSQIDKMAHYDFTYYNIATLAQQMLMKVNGGIEEAIMSLFDDWTRKWHYDENSSNRHYFDGWKTNDAFAVNKKVITPFYGAFGYWGDKFDPSWDAQQKLRDIEKVFNFLDGGVVEGMDVMEVIKAARAEGKTKNIQCKHFLITFYKKGTAHITFTNLDVLHRFNLFAAQGKNWLPPCYGKKRYNDMTAEEKATIDSFEGKESYENVLRRRDYFLPNTTQLRLGAG